jgi:hypothetical protein
MWGSKRNKKRDEAVVDEAVVTTDGLDIDSLRRKANRAAATPATRNQVATKAQFPTSQLGDLFESYLKIMEEAVESEDFASIVTPESIKLLFQQIPGLEANAELSEMLQSPQFQEPALLQQTIKEGLRTMKAYSSQILATLNDPEQISALIGQLPAEAQQAAQAILSGDLSSLSEMISSLPGISDSQRNMLDSLIKGNTQGLMDSIQSTFGDDDQIEAARLQFLSEPSLAEAFSIPSEVLNDPSKWRELMEQSMDLLVSQGGDEEASDIEAPTSTLFGGRQAI